MNMRMRPPTVFFAVGAQGMQSTCLPNEAVDSRQHTCSTRKLARGACYFLNKRHGPSTNFILDQVFWYAFTYMYIKFRHVWNNVRITPKPEEQTWISEWHVPGKACPSDYWEFDAWQILCNNHADMDHYHYGSIFLTFPRRTSKNGDTPWSPCEFRCALALPHSIIINPWGTATPCTATPSNQPL